MVDGLELQLLMDDCSATAEDTAALRRVLEIFKQARDEKIKSAPIGA
jgi:hypothetical protein